jgi:hypothetical protein
VTITTTGTAGAPTGIKAEAPPKRDSAGISAVVPLAEHPENPRTGAGDITELAASTAVQGLFEPLIVVTAAAYARKAASADTRARRSRT